MKLQKTLGGAAAVAGLLALSLASSGTAQADTNVGNTTTLVATGSDTTQDVMEGLSGVVKDANGNPLLSNYKATAIGRTINTRTGNANCSFTVPKNSGEGTDALSAAMRGATFAGSPAVVGGAVVTSANMTNCVNVARTSSGNNPTTSPGIGTITYVPFATDSVTYATQAASGIPHSLNKADLVAIYTANTGSCIFEPLIPAPGSGTRSFWAKFLGLTDTFGTGGWGTCVKDTIGTVQVQEHDGRALTNGNQLVPISVAQFIAQTSGTISDLRGNASLGAIDFTSANSGVQAAVSPILLQSNYSTATRTVYNAVPTAALATAPTSTVFSGSTSLICSNSLTISQYGFAPISTCGATTKTNTN